MLGINLMRIARPFMMLAEKTRPSRIPFPPQIGRVQNIVITNRKFAPVQWMDKKNGEIKELRGLCFDDSPFDYVHKALELKRKWDDPALLVEIQKHIDKAFIRSCEKGYTAVVGAIVDGEHLNECNLKYYGLKDVVQIKLPEVKLSHIPENNLNYIVMYLLEREVKKLTIEDFEWALVHKKDTFFKILLTHLTNDKKTSQLAIKNHPFANLEEDKFGLEDPIYGSFEFILEHPRLIPFQELGRTYMARYNASLLKRCVEGIHYIQEMMNRALKAQLSTEELCELKEFGDAKICTRYGEISLPHAREQLHLLKNLLAAKDYSSMHWLSKHRLWEPRPLESQEKKESLCLE